MVLLSVAQSMVPFMLSHMYLPSGAVAVSAVYTEHTLDTPEHVTGTAWEHQSTAEAQTALRLCYGLGTALQEQQALRQALQQLRNQNPDTVLRAR